MSTSVPKIARVSVLIGYEDPDEPDVVIAFNKVDSQIGGRIDVGIEVGDMWGAMGGAPGHFLGMDPMDGFVVTIESNGEAVVRQVADDEVDEVTLR